jgi:fatty acid desaturase
MEQARNPAMLWAWIMLVGHTLVAYLSISCGLWLVPVMISLGPFYNGWLFWLCNSTQHVGMSHGTDHNNTINDFRLNTRTFYLNNPVVRCWYWHMNWHTEHHMYAAVPCYHLAAVHRAIKHQLPHTPDGLVGVWKAIWPVLHKQKENPNFVQPIEIPPPSEKKEKAA